MSKEDVFYIIFVLQEISIGSQESNQNSSKTSGRGEKSTLQMFSAGM